MKKGRFTEGLPFLQKSLRFFSGHPLVDKLRPLLLFSASSLSYRVMALCNIAFCHGQIGDKEQMKTCYREALTLNPENPIALAAWKIIETSEGPRES